MQLTGCVVDLVGALGTENGDEGSARRLCLMRRVRSAHLMHVRSDDRTRHATTQTKNNTHAVTSARGGVARTRIGDPNAHLLTLVEMLQKDKERRARTAMHALAPSVRSVTHTWCGPQCMPWHPVSAVLPTRGAARNACPRTQCPQCDPHVVRPAVHVLAPSVCNATHTWCGPQCKSWHPVSAVRPTLGKDCASDADI